MGRTNIVMDDDLVRRAMRITRAKSKRQLVDIALRKLVRQHETYEGILKLRGKLEWEGDVDRWRRSR